MDRIEQWFVVALFGIFGVALLNEVAGIYKTLKGILEELQRLNQQRKP